MNTALLRSQAVIVLLAWGVFALGASRPWAYVPLLAGMAVYGVVALLTVEKSSALGYGLCLSFFSVCAAIALQLVPLPVGVVNAISPNMMDVDGGAAAVGFRPLSISPGATTVGLACVMSLGLFFAGAVRTMRAETPRRVAIGLIGLGTGVALAGIAESSHLWRGIYDAAGLSLPPDSTPLGPFSSRNHYAAWMLMTLALAMGYLCAILERRHSPSHAGERTSAAGSPHRATTSVVLLAVIAMAISLIQTMSRAGILGVGVTVVAMSALLIRRSSTTRARLLLATPLLLLPLTGIAIAGVQPIARRFTADTWSTAHGRLPIWRQTMAIARDFPIAGSGFNTYQRIVPSYRTAALHEPYEGAHNDYLQLAAEGGFLVGLPAAMTLAFFTREIRQRFRDRSDDSMTRWIRIGSVIGISLIAIQETVEFSLQVPGNAALFVVVAAIAVHRGSAGEEMPSHAQ